MKVLRLVLKEHNWAITILYNSDCLDIDRILEYLQSIDCPIYLQEEASNNIIQCKLNTGLTYSNFKLRRSIMLISNTSSTKETINTIVHECYHFIQHLLKTQYATEEQMAILIGNLVAEIIQEILIK